jgi:WW domain-binding protein 2
MPSRTKRKQRIRSHLHSWVMLSPSTPPFTPLPLEQTLFTSPPRIAFSLSTPSHYPGKQQNPPFSLTHPAGILYLTTRRIIYLPDKPTEKLQSFAAPILNLHDSHVTAPFFGPNVWTAALQPVQGGGIPVTGPRGGLVEIKLTFKEGGAFDFHTKFEQVKERLQQAVEVSRSDAGTSSSSAANNLDALGNVNMEDLPAYQEDSDGPLISPVGPPVVPIPWPTEVQHIAVQRDSGVGVEDDRPKPAEDVPNEPPPGYEEAQMQGLREEVERRMSEEREED